ncbi:hypothetical protein PVAND_001399 [Polypedilum vanderplanki]|uniref:Tetraspanin n=1 Tax=Polypedilum vanderplanki TaxID=319348 RepID=A0A9J6BMV3_POLVA|nr:hypothetical protein PVAND_001399 [Polypedilum vanderplanki]
MRSEKSFKCLYRVLIFLLASEIILGILISIICEYVKLFIQSHFFQIDSHEVQSVIFIIKIFGLHISICFFCGIMVISLVNDVYTHHLKFLIKLWIFFLIESSIGSLFLTWMFVDTINYVTSNLENSLIDGIKLYTKDPMWVLIWDDLQYDYKCCGIYNHTDWAKIVHKSTKEISTAWLPFSCAKNHYPLKNILEEDNIFSTGCFEVLSEIMERLKVIIVSINVIISILMVLIIILMRTAFTYKRIYTEFYSDFESDESIELQPQQTENETCRKYGAFKNKMCH